MKCFHECIVNSPSTENVIVFHSLNRGWPSAIAAHFTLPTAITFLVSFARNMIVVAPRAIAFKANIALIETMKNFKAVLYKLYESTNYCMYLTLSTSSLLPSIEISAGHRSLTGKIIQFVR